jgi:hypothetical protein
MTKARLDGLQMLILGSVFFVAIGVMMEFTNPLGMTDFQEIYYGSRSVAYHYDPYRPDQLEAFYGADTGSLPSDSGVSHTRRLILFISSNLPTTLFLIAPLAAMPWKWAVAAWMVLTAAAFIFACFLMWKLGADSAPRLYAGLIVLILVNSGLLLCTGNPAGLVVSLSVIAVWCFLQQRFIPAGILCLAVALAMKPHDAGPIWLYFFLVGGVQRKRALQTFALTVVIAVAAVLWFSHVAPHWVQEYHSNLQIVMSPGGRDNPGPTTQGGRGIGQIISLQAILSLIWDNARFYTLAAFLLCAPFFVIWCVRTVRSGFSPTLAWFALASIVPLTMLPVYHRTYDARLLLLAVPACAMLWEKVGAAKWSALLLTIAGIVLTGDWFWIVFFQLTHYSGPAGTFAMFPAPLILLALAALYLWAYIYLANSTTAAVAPKVELSGNKPTRI